MPPAETPLIRPLVLVVDDEESVRRVFSKFLSEKGYRVVTASNGEEARRIALEKRPQAILLDILLPGEPKGFELCGLLRNDPRTQGIHILLMTGEFVSEGDRLRGLRLGALEYFRKPVPMGELEAKLNALFPAQRPTIRSGTPAAVATKPQFLEPSQDAPTMQISRPKLETKVLIAEDEAENAQCLKILVEQLGMTPVLADNGKKALQSALEEEPDIALLDVLMPGMDGLEILGKLHTSPNPALSELPVILVTCMDSFPEKERAYQMGCDDFVSKTIVAELGYKIPAVLKRVQKHQTRRGIRRTDAYLRFSDKTLFIGEDSCLQLSDLDFELVRLLMTHHRPMSGGKIAAQLWLGDYNALPRDPLERKLVLAKLLDRVQSAVKHLRSHLPRSSHRIHSNSAEGYIWLDK